MPEQVLSGVRSQHHQTCQAVQGGRGVLTSHNAVQEGGDAGVADTKQKGGRAAQVSAVFDWLYLSGARGVRAARLRELGVTFVVNGTVELPVVPLDGVEAVVVPVADGPRALITPYLHTVADRLEAERVRGGRALVHCVAGVSRSPALVLAYLVKHTPMTLRQAFQHLRSVRPNVRPNASFFRQLIAFEEEVRGSASVSVVLDDALGLAIPDVCEDELKVLKDSRWAALIRERRNFQRLYA